MRSLEQCRYWFALGMICKLPNVLAGPMALPPNPNAFGASNTLLAFNHNVRRPCTAICTIRENKEKRLWTISLKPSLETPGGAASASCILGIKVKKAEGGLLMQFTDTRRTFFSKGCAFVLQKLKSNDISRCIYAIRTPMFVIEGIYD